MDNDHYDDLDLELEIDGENAMDESQGHDPKNAVAREIAQTDKATDAVKKRAPARKGDKSNSEPMQKANAKAAMMGAVVAKLSGMKSDDLIASYSKVMGEDWDTEAEVTESSFDYSGALADMVENEATLSEEFKEKTAVLFESAVNEAVAQEVARLDEKYEETISEAIEDIQEDMVDKVDGYLNYVVENWIEENKLAIEKGIRTEIAEDFIEGLKSLFVESYIEIPESKVDLVDELSDEVASLEEQLNQATLDSIELAEANIALVKERVISENSDGLTLTQAEKLASLCESVDFDDIRSFERKIEIIKEAHFTNPTKSAEILEESVSEFGNEEPISTSSDPIVAAALKALRGSQS